MDWPNAASVTLAAGPAFGDRREPGIGYAQGGLLTSSRSASKTKGPHAHPRHAAR